MDVRYKGNIGRGDYVISRLTRRHEKYGNIGKRSYFLVFVQLFEKYGTSIERNTLALIEKVSPCSAAVSSSVATRHPVPDSRLHFAGACAPTLHVVQTVRSKFGLR
eukprot:SAG31_NODE_1877_length_7007_cov_3.257093_3_plen_106_part_00